MRNRGVRAALWLALNGRKTLLGGAGVVAATVAEAVLKPECFPNPLAEACRGHLPEHLLPWAQGVAAAVAVVGVLHKGHKQKLKEEK